MSHTPPHEPTAATASHAAPAVFIGVSVREYYADDAPEEFGTYIYRADRAPELWGRIRLKWLDGTDAHEVTVVNIDDERIHVTADESVVTAWREQHARNEAYIAAKEGAR